MIVVKAEMIDVLSKVVGENFRQDITNALSSESSRPVDDLNKDFQQSRVLKKTWVKMVQQLPSGSKSQIFAIRVLEGIEEVDWCAKQASAASALGSMVA